MATTLASDIAFTQLSMRTKKAILGQCLFLTFALAIPSITHRLGYHYLYAPANALDGLITGLLKKKVTSFGSLAIGMIRRRGPYPVACSSLYYSPLHEN